MVGIFRKVVQLADGGSAFWCEAALRVDVAVWRASPAPHLPRAHVVITCVAPPRASRPPARVACIFFAAICRRPRGGRGRRAENDAGGGDDARVGAARYVRISARGRRRKGARRGAQSHTRERRPVEHLAPLTGLSRFYTFPFSLEGPVSGRTLLPIRNRSVRGVPLRDPPPHFAHTTNRRSENVEITIRRALAASR